MIVISRLLLVAGAAVALVSCGSVAVATKPGQSISRSSRIAVLSPPSDPQAVRGQIEHLLLTSGFDVVSEAVARQRLAYFENQQSDSGRTSTAVSMERTTEMPSELVVRFDYRAYYDIHEWRFTSFNATVVDLQGGRIVASANLSGSKDVKGALDDFVRRLSANAK